jgi:hypothetical protein
MCEWLSFIPTLTPLPHMAHLLAITATSFYTTNTFYQNLNWAARVWPSPTIVFLLAYIFNIYNIKFNAGTWIEPKYDKKFYNKQWILKK